MRSYFWASAFSLFTGWIAQTILLFIGMGVDLFPTVIVALCFSILANLLFIQLPKRRIKQAFFNYKDFTYSSLSFALFFMLYGAAITVLLNGVASLIFFQKPDFFSLFDSKLPFAPGIFANGFVFGFTLRKTWKADFDDLPA